MAIATAQVVGFDLNLSVEEATFLRDVLASVGGHPDNSRRKFQRAISRALEEAGARDSWSLTGRVAQDKRGKIHFDSLPSNG